MYENIRAAAEELTFQEVISFQDFKQHGFTEKQILKAIDQTGMDKLKLISSHKGFYEYEPTHNLKAIATGKKESRTEKKPGYGYDTRTYYEYEVITKNDYQHLRTDKIMYCLLGLKIKGFRELVSPLYNAKVTKDLPLDVKYAMWKSELDNSLLQCCGGFSGYGEVYLETSVGESLYIPLKALLSKDWDAIVERNISYWFYYNKKPKEEVMKTINSKESQGLKELLSK